MNRKKLKGWAAIRRGVELGKIAAKIYGPDEFEHYSPAFSTELAQQAYTRTYWGARRRIVPTRLPDWEELW